MIRLQEGDIITIKIGDVVNAGRKTITVNSETSEYAGMYVVYKAGMEGGGTAHGPGDVYPDGWCVYCEKVDDLSTKISFYQSGCFVPMIRDIVPIGKAERTWKMPAIVTGTV